MSKPRHKMFKTNVNATLQTMQDRQEATGQESGAPEGFAPELILGDYSDMLQFLPNEEHQTEYFKHVPDPGKPDDFVLYSIDRSGVRINEAGHGVPDINPNLEDFKVSERMVNESDLLGDDEPIEDFDLRQEVEEEADEAPAQVKVEGETPPPQVGPELDVEGDAVPNAAGEADAENQMIDGNDEHGDGDAIDGTDADDPGEEPEVGRAYTEEERLRMQHLDAEENLHQIDVLADMVGDMQLGTQFQRAQGGVPEPVQQPNPNDWKCAPVVIPNCPTVDCPFDLPFAPPDPKHPDKKYKGDPFAKKHWNYYKQSVLEDAEKKPIDFKNGMAGATLDDQLFSRVRRYQYEEGEAMKRTKQVPDKRNGGTKTIEFTVYRPYGFYRGAPEAGKRTTGTQLGVRRRAAKCYRWAVAVCQAEDANQKPLFPKTKTQLGGGPDGWKAGKASGMMLKFVEGCMIEFIRGSNRYQKVLPLNFELSMLREWNKQYEQGLLNTNSLSGSLRKCLGKFPTMDKFCIKWFDNRRKKGIPVFTSCLLYIANHAVGSEEHANILRKDKIPAGYKFTIGYVRRLLARNSIIYRTCQRMQQETQDQIHAKMRLFHNYNYRLMKAAAKLNIYFLWIINFDEIPMSYSGLMSGKIKSLCKIGDDLRVDMPASDTKRCGTVIQFAAVKLNTETMAYEQAYIKPILLLIGEPSDEAILNEKYDDGVRVYWTPKGVITAHAMIRCVLPHIREAVGCQIPHNIPPVLVIQDCAPSHRVLQVKQIFNASGMVLSMIPGHCTPHIQWVDIFGAAKLRELMKKGYMQLYLGNPEGGPPEYQRKGLKAPQRRQLLAQLVADSNRQVFEKCKVAEEFVTLGYFFPANAGTAPLKSRHNREYEWEFPEIDDEEQETDALALRARLEGERGDIKVNAKGETELEPGFQAFLENEDGALDLLVTGVADHQTDPNREEEKRKKEEKAKAKADAKAATAKANKDAAMAKKAEKKKEKLDTKIDKLLEKLEPTARAQIEADEIDQWEKLLEKLDEPIKSGLLDRKTIARQKKEVAEAKKKEKEEKEAKDKATLERQQLALKHFCANKKSVASVGPAATPAGALGRAPTLMAPTPAAAALDLDGDDEVPKVEGLPPPASSFQALPLATATTTTTTTGGQTDDQWLQWGYTRLDLAPLPSEQAGGNVSTYSPAPATNAGALSQTGSTAAGSQKGPAKPQNELPAALTKKRPPYKPPVQVSVSHNYNFGNFQPTVNLGTLNGGLNGGTLLGIGPSDGTSRGKRGRDMGSAISALDVDGTALQGDDHDQDVEIQMVGTQQEPYCLDDAVIFDDAEVDDDYGM